MGKSQNLHSWFNSKLPSELMVTRGRHANGLQLFVPGNLGFPLPSNAIFHIRPWAYIFVHVLGKRSITTHTSGATGDATYPSRSAISAEKSRIHKEDGLQIVEIPLKDKVRRFGKIQGRVMPLLYRPTMENQKFHYIPWNTLPEARLQLACSRIHQIK